MDIVLALLRTLIFVVATVAATVYVTRRMARGLPLLWIGATLLVLHWLIDFGWVTYRAGSPGTPEIAGWVVWTGYLLTFVAALAFIWGIGQAAGLGSRPRPDAQPAGAGGSPAELPAGPGAGASGAAPSSPAGHGGWHPTGGQVATGAAAGAAASASSAGAPSDPHHRHRPRPPGLVVPHAVPVVMTPASHHHSPPDPDPVVDLGPDEDAVPEVAAPPPGTPPIAPAGWAPTGSRPASSPDTPAAGSSPPEGGSKAGPQAPS